MRGGTEDGHTAGVFNKKKAPRPPSKIKRFKVKRGKFGVKKDEKGGFRKYPETVRIPTSFGFFCKGQKNAAPAVPICAFSGSDPQKLL